MSLENNNNYNDDNKSLKIIISQVYMQQWLSSEANWEA